VILCLGICNAIEATRTPNNHRKQPHLLKSHNIDISRENEKNNTNYNHYKSKFCDLCRHKFTHILATGRSGSTTVLAMLNQLTGYDITGEHGGQLNHLYQAYKAETSIYSENIYSWLHGSESLVDSQHEKLCWMQEWFYRRTTKEFWLPADVHGFKEIVSEYFNDILSYIH
jgi:hypothetical protein